MAYKQYDKMPLNPNNFCSEFKKITTGQHVSSANNNLIPKPLDAERDKRRNL